jgi:hypothetical protein
MCCGPQLGNEVIIRDAQATSLRETDRVGDESTAK